MTASRQLACSRSTILGESIRKDVRKKSCCSQDPQKLLTYMPTRTWEVGTLISWDCSAT